MSNGWTKQNSKNGRQKQIDIEIEACEIAIKNAYAKVEVEDLEKRIIELLKKRREIDE